jgi:hypothetical protein
VGLNVVLGEFSFPENPREIKHERVQNVAAINRVNNYCEFQQLGREPSVYKISGMFFGENVREQYLALRNQFNLGAANFLCAETGSIFVYPKSLSCNFLGDIIEYELVLLGS